MLGSGDEPGSVVTEKLSIVISYCINNTIGKPSVPHDQFTVIKDSFTSGDSFRDIMEDIKSNMGRYPATVVLAVDHFERRLRSDMTASNEICQEFGINVFPL